MAAVSIPEHREAEGFMDQQEEKAGSQKMNGKVDQVIAEHLVFAEIPVEAKTEKREGPGDFIIEVVKGIC